MKPSLDRRAFLAAAIALCTATSGCTTLQEIAALRRRLKVSARRNRKLSSDTELLLKKVEKAE